MRDIKINAGKINNSFSGEILNLTFIENNSNSQGIDSEDGFVKIFLSYSHKDEDIKNELELRLNTLNKVKVWSDKSIEPGDEWDKEIRRELETSHIILLLISPDFISSGYIQNIEVKRALEKRELELVTIIPVFCRFYDGDDSQFLKYQGLPRNRRFIKTLTGINIMLVEETIDGIKEIIDKIPKAR